MQLSKPQKALNEVQTEVFNLIVGYDDVEKINKKKKASRRSLEARRAIERHFEEKELFGTIDEPWSDD
ncbi:MAG: PA3496 family putative envelope integrity protein [Pontibacterium sp.]